MNTKLPPASILPLHIEDLLRCRGVESARVEFKATWDEKTVGPQILATICAFANDFYNVNGGYVVIGVAEQNGRAVLPPAGLDPARIDAIQKWLTGNARRLRPEVQWRISPETVAGKDIVVIWVPGSDARPHQAPDRDNAFAYYVREGSQTRVAKGKILTDLLDLCAKIPFDDRRAVNFTPRDLRSMLVREFLHDVRSGLLDEPDDLEIYRKLRLTAPVNNHEVPRNVALLFFSEDPEQAFPGARIEVVHFHHSGDLLEERIFRGPLPKQIGDCLRYVESPLYVQKHPDRPEAETHRLYPQPALEECIVNAVYHRSYEGVYEPVKVYFYPDRVEITNYPGPVPGLNPAHFSPGARIPAVPARNRRIGEFFKELRLAEARGTGIRKIFQAMADNGSPPPRFEFDAGRTYFTAILPKYVSK